MKFSKSLNAAFRDAPINDVPLLVGYAEDEGITRRPLTEKVSKSFEKEAKATYEGDTPGFLALYPTEGDDATASARTSSHDWVLQGVVA